MESKNFDYVIGSELVYAEEQEPLLNALLTVTASDTCRLILYYRPHSEIDEAYMNERVLKYFEIESKTANILILKRIPARTQV